MSRVSQERPITFKQAMRRVAEARQDAAGTREDWERMKDLKGANPVQLAYMLGWYEAIEYFFGKAP